LTLCKLFGFQTEHPLDDNKREGEWVRSNLDNQIEHLTMILKWRMDRCNTPNAQHARCARMVGWNLSRPLPELAH